MEDLASLSTALPQRRTMINSFSVFQILLGHAVRGVHPGGLTRGPHPAKAPVRQRSVHPRYRAAGTVLCSPSPMPIGHRREYGYDSHPHQA